MSKRPTSFNVVMPISYSSCPQNMTAKECPLRVYIKTENSVFVQISDYLHLPEKNSKNWHKIQEDLERMKSICENCRAKNKGK